MNRLKKFFALCSAVGILTISAQPALSAEETSKTPKLDAELQQLDSLLGDLERIKHQIILMPADATPTQVEVMNSLLLRTLHQLNELYGDTGRDALAEKLLKQQIQLKNY